MSQSGAASTPKFKIVFSPNSKRGRGRPPVRRNNDLEQAVNSITYTDSPSGSTVKEVRKGNMVVNQSQEKIVFLPKYVQKKVTVIRGSPKNVISMPTQLPKVKGMQFVQRVQPSSSGSSGVTQPLQKKRKLLGDMAMKSFVETPKKDNRVESRDQAESPSLLCRVCGSLIEDVIIPLIEAGELTIMGTKLKTIVGTDINDSPLYPPACCKPCSFKINVCFSLLIELQASDEVVRCTYADLQEGDLVNPAAHIYTCHDCQQEVVGMRDFISHYEAHMQAKTIEQPDVKPDRIEEEMSEDDVMLRAQMYLEEEADDGTITFQNEAESEAEDPLQTYEDEFLEETLEEGEETAEATEGEDDGMVMEMIDEDELVEPDIVEMASKSGSPKKDTKDKVSCVLCGRTVLASAMFQHLATVHGKPRFMCDTCNEGFAMKSQLRNHMMTHIGKSEDKLIRMNYCHVCDRDLDSEMELQEHLLTEHGLESTMEGAQYSCKVCGKRFNEFYQVKSHLKMYHHIELSSRTTVVRRPTKCEVCHAVMKSANAARTHMRTVHNLSNKQMESLKESCEECGKRFSQKANLINHINSAHLNVRPMVCDFCGARFIKHSALILHRFRHTGEKHFQCGFCLGRYRQRNDVIRHLARHVRDGEVEYEEAYAVNTSSSRFISKRQIFLRDSTMKGIKASCIGPSKKTRKSKLDALPDIIVKNRKLKPGSNMQLISEETEDGGEEVEYIVDDDGNLVPKTEGQELPGQMHYVQLEGEGGEDGRSSSDEMMAGKRYIVSGDNGATEFILEDDDDYLVVPGSNPGQRVQVAEVMEAEEADEERYTFLNDNRAISPNGTIYRLEEDDDGHNYLVKMDDADIE